MADPKPTPIFGNIPQDKAPKVTTPAFGPIDFAFVASTKNTKPKGSVVFESGDAANDEVEGLRNKLREYEQRHSAQDKLYKTLKQSSDARLEAEQVEAKLWEKKFNDERRRVQRLAAEAKAARDKETSTISTLKATIKQQEDELVRTKEELKQASDAQLGGDEAEADSKRWEKKFNDERRRAQRVIAELKADQAVRDLGATATINTLKATVKQREDELVRTKEEFKQAQASDAQLGADEVVSKRWEQKFNDEQRRAERAAARLKAAQTIRDKEAASALNTLTANAKRQGEELLRTQKRLQEVQSSSVQQRNRIRELNTNNVQQQETIRQLNQNSVQQKEIFDQFSTSCQKMSENGDRLKEANAQMRDMYEKLHAEHEALLSNYAFMEISFNIQKQTLEDEQEKIKELETAIKSEKEANDTHDLNYRSLEAKFATEQAEHATAARERDRHAMALTAMREDQERKQKRLDEAEAMLATANSDNAGINKDLTAAQKLSQRLQAEVSRLAAEDVKTKEALANAKLYESTNASLTQQMKDITALMAEGPVFPNNPDAFVGKGSMGKKNLADELGDMEFDGSGDSGKSIDERSGKSSGAESDMKEEIAAIKKIPAATKDHSDANSSDNTESTTSGHSTSDWSGDDTTPKRPSKQDLVENLFSRKFNYRGDKGKGKKSNVPDRYFSGPSIAIHPQPASDEMTKKIIQSAADANKVAMTDLQDRTAKWAEEQEKAAYQLDQARQQELIALRLEKDNEIARLTLLNESKIKVVIKEVFVSNDKDSAAEGQLLDLHSDLCLSHNPIRCWFQVEKDLFSPVLAWFFAFVTVLAQAFSLLVGWLYPARKNLAAHKDNEFKGSINLSPAFGSDQEKELSGANVDENASKEMKQVDVMENDDKSSPVDPQSAYERKHKDIISREPLVCKRKNKTRKTLCYFFLHCIFYSIVLMTWDTYRERQMWLDANEPARLYTIQLLASRHNGGFMGLNHMLSETGWFGRHNLRILAEYIGDTMGIFDGRGFQIPG